MRNNIKLKAIKFIPEVIFILLFIPMSFINSQIFLEESPSPQANAMGLTFGNLISTDPMASIINPAYLGFFAQKHNFGFAGFKRELLPGLEYSCFSVSGGYSLKRIPISFGIGYNRIFLDLGENTIYDNYSSEPLATFSSHDKADILSTSVLLDHYIQIGVGINFKFIESVLAPDWVMQIVDIPKPIGTATGNAYDIGTSIQIPFIKLFSELCNRSVTISPNMRPFLQSGISYSVTNIGDEITYGNEDPGYWEPLPRTAYLGFNSSIGIEYDEKDYNFKILAYQWSTESEGSLLERYFTDEGISATKYRSSIFDVDNKYKKYKNGWSFNILDIFFIRRGRYHDKVYNIKYNTNGLGINFIQPIRLLLKYKNQSERNHLLVKLIYLFDIEYHEFETQYSVRYNHSDNSYSGITLKLKTIF